MDTTLVKHRPVTKIRLPRSNKINRAIYTDGEKFYINYNLGARTIIINDVVYTEVKKIQVSEKESWYV